MNLHDPIRQPDESQAQYRSRQRDSRAVVERATKPHLFKASGERIYQAPRSASAGSATGIFAIIAKAARKVFA